MHVKKRNSLLLGKCIVKSEPKRRGRKRKNHEQVITPEFVVDYIIFNYPFIGLNKIRDKVLNEIKNHDPSHKIRYILDVFDHNDNKYYRDMYGNILDNNAKHVGHIWTHNGTSVIHIYSEMIEIDNTFEINIIAKFNKLKNIAGEKNVFV